jgi:hypothetical protein
VTNTTTACSLSSFFGLVEIDNLSVDDGNGAWAMVSASLNRGVFGNNGEILVIIINTTMSQHTTSIFTAVSDEEDLQRCKGSNS